jgi:hypothetical protein
MGLGGGEGYPRTVPLIVGYGQYLRSRMLVITLRSATHAFALGRLSGNCFT